MCKMVQGGRESLINLSVTIRTKIQLLISNIVVGIPGITRVILVSILFSYPLFKEKKIHHLFHPSQHTRTKCHGYSTWPSILSTIS